jgi:replicative DNA helicase
VAPEVKAEDVLRQMVISIGQAAEQRAIREEEDLDTLVEQVQEQVYRERYGS